jgi:hypothetical protein
MSDEKLYKLVWMKDSPNPGFIEPQTYRESEIPEDHNFHEVVGPHRNYVEAIPGTDFYILFVDSNILDPETHENLMNVDKDLTRYNWDTGSLDIVYFPDRVWDDIRAVRNIMLSSCDNMFNEDTPDPLKSEWIEYRQMLRNMISREQAAERTPDTVKWNDYVPPFPKSARIGVPEDQKLSCAWYKGKDTYPPEAIIGSPESTSAHEEFIRNIQRVKDSKS